MGEMILAQLLLEIAHNNYCILPCCMQDVDELRKKIKDSNVLVEFDSQDNNLSDTLNKIRSQYEKLAKKNLKDTDDWYQSKVWRFTSLSMNHTILLCLFINYLIPLLLCLFIP